MTSDGIATWETYLRSQFPAYLLPKSAVEKLSIEEASRFLEALADKPSAFTMLRNVSFLAPRMADLRSFVERVRLFVRALPSTTEITQRYWNGGFQGKLDLRTTTLLHASRSWSRRVQMLRYCLAWATERCSAWSYMASTISRTWRWFPAGRSRSR